MTTRKHPKPKAPPKAARKPATSPKAKAAEESTESISEKRARLRAQYDRERAEREDAKRAARHDASGGAWGDWRDVFLAELRTHSSVRAACKAAGINRKTAYEARSLIGQGGNDKGAAALAVAKVFAAAWDEAIEDATDLLEEEARRRAVEGVEKERYDKDGNLISVETEYSDTLLLKLLVANRRSKFGDRAQGQFNVDLSSLSTEQLERIAAGEDVLSVITSARAG